MSRREKLKMKIASSDKDIFEAKTRFLQNSHESQQPDLDSYDIPKPNKKKVKLQFLDSEIKPLIKNEINECNSSFSFAQTL